jgi:acetolactate synthase small subunit
MKDRNSIIADIENLKNFKIVELAIKENGNYYDDKKTRGVIIEGEKEILATVSDKYKLVQFSSVFLPAISNIGDFDGHLINHKGKAKLFVFPKGDIFTGEHNSKIGIFLDNSIDKSSAIQIGFAIHFDSYCISLPTEQKNFRKIHTGKPLELTTDFLQGLESIKNSWKLLVEKYKEFGIDTETKESIYKELKLTKNARARINEKEIKNLWELFIATLDTISRKSFKSEIHKQKKIEKIVDIFTTYSIGVSL